MTALLRPRSSVLRRLPSREAVLTVLLFAALMATVLALGQPQAQTVPYDPASGSATGWLGLRWWLEDLGYRVDLVGRREFNLPSETRLLFVYPGQQPYTRPEALSVMEWVTRGNTLVLVGPDSSDTALTEMFGARPRVSPEAVGSRLVQRQPILPDTNAELGRLGLQPVLALDKAPQAIPVITTETDLPTAALMSLGKGVVWFLSPQHSLVNEQLRDPQQAQLALAILRTVPAGSRVVFDDYHWAGREAGVQTLTDWLYDTPTGWATLFIALTCLLYLLLQGIRLGRPLPSKVETRRREAAEYVTALAGLQRRAHIGQSVAAYHKRRLKLGLGRSLRLSPDLDDAAFLARLAEDGRLPPERLTAARVLLAHLSRRPDEAGLVRLAQRVDEVLE